MDIRREHPEILSEFELAPARPVRAWALAFLLFWLLLAAWDWAARFALFRWQDLLWNRPAPAQVQQTPAAATSRVVPAQTGAGLARMVPVPWIASRYMEEHPEFVKYHDAWGYANPPPPADGYYPVVMTGDSFMLSLGTQNVAQVLADLGRIPVYNHARQGSGPLLEIQRFIFSTRFEPSPKVVVWNLLGRELGAPLFLRQPVEAWFAKINVWDSFIQKEERGGLRWRQLATGRLSRDWPDTSVIAYLCRRGWGLAELAAFRECPRDLLGAAEPQLGPMLLYRENLRVLPLLAPGENVPGVVKTVARIARGLRERGSTLVILLVPEKEQIHLHALSPADRQALASGPQLFADIETGLEQEGVPVVNLWPVFRQATAAGQRLYWRDDTHWNDAGIRLAAEELWRVVEPLLK